MQCKVCHTEFSDELQRCPECGTQVTGDIQPENNQNMQQSEPIVNQEGQDSNKVNMNPGMNMGMNAGMNPVMNPGMNPGMNMGMNPGMNMGMNPGMNPGMNMGMNPGMNMGMNPGYNPYMSQQPQYQETESEQRKRFFRSLACAVPRRLVIAASVMMYVSAFITLILAINGGIQFLLDVALITTMGVLLQVQYSRVVAVLTGIYSAINVIALLLMTHVLGGELIVIAAVLGIVGTFMLHSRWNDYRSSGYMPQSY